jgi:hypothetical protein
VSARKPKRPKRDDEDMNETAYRVVQESIRERPEPKPPAQQDQPAKKPS